MKKGRKSKEKKVREKKNEKSEINVQRGVKKRNKREEIRGRKRESRSVIQL